jgi:hypothetical protein
MWAIVSLPCVSFPLHLQKEYRRPGSKNFDSSVSQDALIPCIGPMLQLKCCLAVYRLGGIWMKKRSSARTDPFGTRDTIWKGCGTPGHWNLGAI